MALLLMPVAFQKLSHVLVTEKHVFTDIKAIENVFIVNCNDRIVW